MPIPREPRVPMQLRVEVHGKDWEGKPYEENTFTVNVSRTGVRLDASSGIRHTGESLELRRGKDKAPYRVIWIGRPGTTVQGQIGLRCLDPVKNIWGVPMPPPKLVLDDAELPLSSPAPEAPPPVVAAEPPPAAAEASPAILDNEAPVPAASAETPAPLERSDTVAYGPQFPPELPEPQGSSVLAFLKRPVVYYSLATALLLAIVFGWKVMPPSAEQPSVPPPAAAASTQAPAELSPPPQAALPVPAQTQAAEPKPQPAAPVAAGTFGVQVGAYEGEATAQALASDLSSHYGAKALVDDVEVNGKTLHRVRLRVSSRAQAKDLAARLRRERQLDAIVVKLE